jgi:hypothetical protein
MHTGAYCIFILEYPNMLKNLVKNVEISIANNDIKKCLEYCLKYIIVVNRNTVSFNPFFSQQKHVDGTTMKYLFDRNGVAP